MNIMAHKFDPKKLAKLDSPQRRKLLPPENSLQKLKFKSGQKVADIGCAIGYFSIPLAELVGENGRVYGLDIVPEMLEEARLRAGNSYSNLSFLVSDENKLPLENEEVEAVFLAALVHELEDTHDFFQEVKRILKPGGKVKIIEWKKEKMGMGPTLTDRISQEEMIRILDKNGFEVKEQLDIGAGHYGVIAEVSAN